MPSSFKRVLTAALLACALVSPNLILRAQDGRPATRPRRATAPEWPTTSEPVVLPEVEPEVVRLSKEPVIRIGIATGARSVNISTTGTVLNATGAGDQPLPLELARVRIEPRAYPPLPTLAPESEGGVQTASTSPNRTTPPPAPAARTKAVREAGGDVRLTARASAPVRGEALYAPGSAKPLHDLRTPVVFAPEDAELHPVRYNEKPYRGRLEVFANSKGTLTVVNVVPLEDYVRGVVPNELSPGGWPELEALKAQAVAARTYAVSNLGRFSSEGYDLTPDIRSQVYGGRSTEHPLTDRAVAETRGRILTYKGAPVNAFYTSTCGGRTEDGENIFGGAPLAYLRGRECALEAAHRFVSLSLRTSREPASVKSAEHQTSARDAALLAVHGFDLPARLGDEWLAASVTAEEARGLLSRVASLARQAAPNVGADAARPSGFATALAAALDGESRGATLLNSADVEYLLAFRDAEDVPQQNRADVAAMLREGHLALLPDGTLRPRQPLTRARALRSAAHALEARGLLRLQKATARLVTNNALAFRPPGGKDLSVTLGADAYLFRAYGEALFGAREVQIVGGEAVVYHSNARGEVDYLEVRPAPNGAASDRASRFTNWAETLTPSGVMSRLSRWAPSVGTLLDLRVLRRGVSGRVLDLEVVGTAGTAHVRGGRVRSALGLREQLFVIDRAFDESGRVTKFTFTGRGFGHGVGMCQVGAYGLARAGLSYEKILKHFYTGVALTKAY